MFVGRLLQHILLFTAFLWGVAAFGYPNGIGGVYQGGCAGGACHGGNANAATTLTLTGSTTVKATALAAFTLRVAHQAQQAAGFNLAVTNSNGQKVAGLANGANSYIVNADELTHNQPVGFGGTGGADFAFTWTAPAAHGSYTIYAAGNAVNNNNNAGGDVWNTRSWPITVTGATITAPAGSPAYCVGASINITWTQTGITTIRIELSRDNFINTTVINNGIAATAGQYNYTIPTTLETSSNYVIRLVNTANGDELARTNPMTISGAPTVATHPQDQSICAGRTLNLIAGGTGASLTYQWRKGGVNIPGANAGTLSIPNAQESDAGSYDCVITSCNQNVTTNAATVTILKKPTITKEVSGDTAVCEGAMLSFAVEASGDGLVYQWLFNGTQLVGANSATLNLPGVVLSQEGTYRCVVTGLCSPPDSSAPLVLNILEPAAITDQPTDVTVKVGEKLTLTVKASGEQLRYQWLHKGVPIAGATSATYTVNTVAFADSGAYACRVGNNCDSVLSRSAKVTVLPATGPGVFVLAFDTLNLDEIGQCAGADTVIAGLLRNEGGSPVEITSASTEPSAVLAIGGVTFPVVLQPGAAIDVQIIVTPTDDSPINAQATFFAQGGNLKFTVLSGVRPDLSFDADTITFPSGMVGAQQAIVTLPLPCPQAMVTDVTISGPGAATFAIDSFGIGSDAEVPLMVNQGNAVTVWVRTTQETGSDAVLRIASTAGAAQVVLRRGEVNSVEEYTSIPGMAVWPNPMTDHLVINMPSEAPTRVQVFTVLGSQVQELFANGDVRWDGRDRSGQLQNSGLYILLIEHDGRAAMAKVLIK